MMKRIIYISIALVAGLLLSSCNKDNAGSGYLNLSVNGYTFGWSGGDTLRVEVMTNAGEWTAEPDSPAIKAEKDGDEAVITMQPNETSEYVSGTVTFTAGGLTRELYVDQMPKMYDGMFKDFPLTDGDIAMSRNGKYIGYITQTLQSDDTYKYESWLLDTETGEVKVLEEPPYAGAGETNYNGIRCLSDDARFIVFQNDGEAVYAMTIDGEPYDIKVPDGYHSPGVEQMSADGSVWVGYIKKEGGPLYVPCKWVDGEPEVLEYPEILIDGVTPTYNGTMARGCSDDGSVIYGSEWTSFLMLYWVDDELVNIGYDNGELINESDSVNGLHTESQNTSMSPDGRYVGCKYGLGSMSGAVPALIDTQTGRYYTMDFDGTVLTIGPDGTVFGASPSFGVSQGLVLDFENNTSVALEDWLYQEYGVNIGSGRMVNKVSTDGNVLFGYRISAGAMGASYSYWFIRLK